MRLLQLLRSAILEQASGNVKPGVEELFKSNQELASIGTPEEYSKYLDTIFPQSKVKDVLYHGTKEQFDKFDLGTLGKNTNNKYKAIFLTPDIKLATSYGKRLISALANIKGEVNLNSVKQAIVKDSKLAKNNLEEFNKLTIDEIEEFLESEKNDVGGKRLEDYLKQTGVTGMQLENKVVVVFDPAQIHLLGSKEDIEGFKKFLENSKK